MKNHKTPIALLIAFLLCLGYSRDFIFKGINVLLYNAIRRTDYAAPDFFFFMQSWSYNNLYGLKWILTLLFTLFYFWLQWKLIELIFHQENINKWLIYFYLILILLATFAFSIGYFMHQTDIGYSFSRKFMGIVQSPLPAMIIIPAALLKIRMEEIQQK